MGACVASFYYKTLMNVAATTHSDSKNLKRNVVDRADIVT